MRPRLFALVALIVVILGGTALGAIASAEAASKSKKKAVDERPRHIVIGLDLSTSNPLVANDAYAAKVAERLGPSLRTLPPHSQVTVRTFGVYDPTRQQLRIDRVISSLAPAEEVAKIVVGIVKGIPTLVKNGTLQAQPATNIVAFLENTAELVDCRRFYTDIVLVSDGIEDRAQIRLLTPTATLPAPKDKLFRSCKSLEMLGIGVGAKSPQLTNHLRDEWAKWAKAAGFKDFSGLNDW